jgi:hypothetical protein
MQGRKIWRLWGSLRQCSLAIGEIKLPCHLRQLQRWFYWSCTNACTTTNNNDYNEKGSDYNASTSTRTNQLL